MTFPFYLFLPHLTDVQDSEANPKRLNLFERQLVFRCQRSRRCTRTKARALVLDDELDFRTVTLSHLVREERRQIAALAAPETISAGGV